MQSGPCSEQEQSGPLAITHMHRYPLGLDAFMLIAQERSIHALQSHMPADPQGQCASPQAA